MSNLVDVLLPLDRPEYAKQTEALLTDLLWRSPGTALGTQDLFRLLVTSTGGTESDRKRLVFDGSSRLAAGVTKTADFVSSIELGDLVAPGRTTVSEPEIIRSFLGAARAPQARGLKSESVVPIFPDLIVLQTLHGMVNKSNPANLAKIIETVGLLGGAQKRGDVAALFARATARRSKSAEQDGGLSFMGEELAGRLARHVWSHLVSPSEPGWEDWPASIVISGGGSDDDLISEELVPRSALAALEYTPFRWFWRHWTTLCEEKCGWSETIPERRFADWSLALLRTGMSFAYLWEARFYIRVWSVLNSRARGSDGLQELRELTRLLEDGESLVRYQPRSVPAVQKEAWDSLARLLARGYLARTVIQEELSDIPFEVEAGVGLVEALGRWLQAVPRQFLGKFKSAADADTGVAKNQKEFVRYLLQPRSADDDSLDQADLYYLLSKNSRNTWLEPGPEWLVVVASLLAVKPDGSVTLGEVLIDLRRLGIAITKLDLVSLLEAAGLTTDSPDADEALVIEAAF